MSVTVLILMLSLFHQNAITSSATFTTASHPFKSPCHQDFQVFKVSNSNLQFPRPSATYRFPRNRKPSESHSQAFPFQGPLQLSVPPGPESLQSSRDKLPISSASATHRALSAHKLPEFITRPSELERTNYFFANILAKITDEDTFDT